MLNLFLDKNYNYKLTVMQWIGSTVVHLSGYNKPLSQLMKVFGVRHAL